MDVRHGQTGTLTLARKHHGSNSAVWLHPPVEFWLIMGRQVMVGEFTTTCQHGIVGLNLPRHLILRAPVKEEKNVCRQTVLTRMDLCNYFSNQQKGSSYQPEKWLTWIPSIRSKDPGPEQIFCQQDLYLGSLT
jgi:hypothetical protein